MLGNGKSAWAWARPHGRQRKLAKQRMSKLLQLGRKKSPFAMPGERLLFTKSVDEKCLLQASFFPLSMGEKGGPNGSSAGRGLSFAYYGLPGR